MPRHPLGERPMTAAERQARHRAAQAAAGTSAVVRTRGHPAADHRSRSRRWLDAVAALTALQAEYAAWLEALPANLRDGSSATAEALQAICDLDLGELQAIEPPRGFGRD